MSKTALICGITGQDGAYLAELLLRKGYKVVGTSRDAQVASNKNLKALGIESEVHIRSATITDFRSIYQCLSLVKPDEIYNLAGQTSVALSFEQPVETLESVAIGTLNLLESIRFLERPIRFYNACSSECFGNVSGPASESTPFRPRSPYAVAKATAFWEVANYREAYGLFSCSGILFNHESPLRPDRFVTKKIVSAACRIAGGSKEKLKVGNIEVRRDWGWAPEFVDGMHRMLAQEKPGDYVLATGESHSLKEFLGATFAELGMNWEDHVEVRSDFFRPLDIAESVGDPSKAKKILGWSAQVRFKELIKRLVEAQRSGKTG